MTGLGIKTHNQYLNKTGQIVDYEVCSTSELQVAKDFYGPSFKYVGSGFITYHNGVRNEWPDLHHFFIRIKNA